MIRRVSQKLMADSAKRKIRGVVPASVYGRSPRMSSGQESRRGLRSPGQKSQAAGEDATPRRAMDAPNIAYGFGGRRPLAGQTHKYGRPTTVVVTTARDRFNPKRETPADVWLVSFALYTSSISVLAVLSTLIAASRHADNSRDRAGLRGNFYTGRARPRSRGQKALRALRLYRTGRQRLPCWASSKPRQPEPRRPLRELRVVRISCLPRYPISRVSGGLGTRAAGSCRCGQTDVRSVYGHRFRVADFRLYRVALRT